MELGPQMDKDSCRDVAENGGRVVLLGLTWKHRCAVSNPASKEVTAASGEGQNSHPMFSAHNGLERGLGSPFEIIWRPQKPQENLKLALVSTSLAGV